MSRSFGVGVALLVVLGPACGGKDRSPESTARLFLRAVDTADSKEIHRLLAPDTQKRLQRLLRLANAQTGGRRRFKPKDLLIAGMNRLPTTKAMAPGKVKVEGNRATVEVLDGKKKVQSLNLVKSDKTGNRWRVVLPKEPLELPQPGPPTPASAPTKNAE